MRDEGLGAPFNVLNVPRDAGLAQVEETFARLYKAARRSAGGDRRRQDLNAALEVLRDEDRRAEAEVEWYHLPLDPAAAVPAPEDLAGELLPLALPEVENPLDAVPAADVGEVIRDYLDKLPAAEWPEPRTLLRHLLAFVALQRLDPWR